MTDLNEHPVVVPQTPLTRGASVPLDFVMVELLYFAYRDFVAEADAVLTRYGFGRAHHRVLYFVYRSPLLRVADVLAVLQITKQSLAPVLRDLVEQGFIIQQAGRKDRRERLLKVSRKGALLVEELTSLQSCRVKAALSSVDHLHQAAVQKFLFHLIDPARQDEIAARLPACDFVK